MKEEEIQARESMAHVEQLIRGADFLDAVYDNPKFEGIAGVYHMQPNTLQAQINILDSPMTINIERFFLSLNHVIEVKGRHFRAGAVRVKDLMDGGEVRNYMIVSQFYPDGG